MPLLGIDIGTTNTKLKVYDEKGRTLSETSFPTPLAFDSYGPYYDAGELFTLLCKAISGFPEKVRKSISALSVSSFAEVMVGLDAKGMPVTRCIPWYDERTKEEVQRVSLDPALVYETTGLFPHHKYSLYKLLWHYRHEPEVFRKVRVWTSMSGFVLFALSGVLSFDYSLASRTMLFDQKRRSWSPTLLALAHLAEDNLAPLMPSGVPLGHVREEVASLAGLLPSTLVVTGGHDHPCAALASGVFTKGWGLISSGTTESLMVPLNDPPVSPGKEGKPFSFGHHVVFPLYYAMGGIYSGGYAIDWALRTLDASYDVFDRLPFAVNQHTPLFFPYLLGGEYEEARGAFLNLSGDTKREDLLRAVLLGLCAEYRIIWERMEEELNYAVTHAVNVGGGVKNHAWMRLKATFLGRPIVVPEEKEGSCQGAALLAGMGSGVYKNAQEAFVETFRTESVFEPMEEMTDVVEWWFATYRDLREVVKSANVRIAQGNKK
ncbi:MAG: FGGY family carbohydrate kinase [Candidatus Caldatribacterium sp.]|uniref:FGGY-family carbohydrate kinase n=1 Tax=Candidatus Caldatribacterium sp. TaxID=2282143 RepID=UPI0029921245|nr:FGGY family carbohydrate kinase [Candidatus Caldatribacterium sp.]MCX7730488.1 FGGY family carbohydrate kinase [Candidatus Caldatribacterium sp.]MDW8081622.1 FGGY family carbohydrate kinase [Candidatus Calescibacterium sp.]